MLPTPGPTKSPQADAAALYKEPGTETDEFAPTEIRPE
ncbi:hypothetical protein FOXB_07635 [Fusarium oxysporum f. sp. conglutinans Fo5176]|uniref:Uncharacterized protein n=2 Tax=Fusarium oxysporum TaxID=5507 RepID=F9FMK5_FUSOF|nr:hypothetical protein FOXB_07635 [Fusarium oxysporum f. sp. conglutinans Fo5176]